MGALLQARVIVTDSRWDGGGDPTKYRGDAQVDAVDGEGCERFADHLMKALLTVSVDGGPRGVKGPTTRRTV